MSIEEQTCKGECIEGKSLVSGVLLSSCGGRDIGLMALILHRRLQCIRILRIRRCFYDVCQFI